MEASHHGRCLQACSCCRSAIDPWPCAQSPSWGGPHCTDHGRGSGGRRLPSSRCVFCDVCCTPCRGVPVRWVSSVPCHQACPATSFQWHAWSSPLAGALEMAIAFARAMLLYVVSYVGAIIVLPMQVVWLPMELLLDRHRRQVMDATNHAWAAICSWLFWRQEVSGVENLPPPGQPAIYVANHQSVLASVPRVQGEGVGLLVVLGGVVWCGGVAVVCCCGVTLMGCRGGWR